MHRRLVELGKAAAAGGSKYLTDEDIEAMERATLAAVSPQAQEEIPGWLLPFDTGVVWRAKSAVPLTHDAPSIDVLSRIEARYGARGLPAVVRVPLIPAFDAFRELLISRGYTEGPPTHVQIVATQALAGPSGASRAELAPRPHDGWAAVYLGAGFDPVDGASRIAILSRAADALYASIRQDGHPVAAGMVAFGHGWASVHGMRTALACRGQGLAGRVLAGMAEAALSRNCPRMFLQVEARSSAALALYARSGFQTAWTYAYWQQPQAA